MHCAPAWCADTVVAQVTFPPRNQHRPKNRRVRRAFLVPDGLHDRKAWLQNRIEELSKIFAISVAGFAILDNHLHMLVRLDPDVAKRWSAEKVARRWGQLHPPRNRRREIRPITHDWGSRPKCGKSN